MGGGSGRSRRLPDEYYDRMADTARDALRSGAQPIKRNVFISFDSDDLSLVNLLRGQAKNENIPLEFNDFSLKEPFDSEKADYIKRGIRERIRQASVTIVYLTDNSAESPWVDWEINESVKLGKAVIAVYQGDTPPKNIPPALEKLGVKPTQWSADGIMNAIEKACENR